MSGLVERACFRSAAGRPCAGIALALLVACGGGHAPAAPGSDAEVSRDASLDAPTAVDATRPRPTDPVLPPADLELILPYMGAEQRVNVDVEARPGKLDVQLSVDTTGSFGGEIDALQADLVESILLAIRARVADVTFGVSRFEDFPAAPFGAESDTPFALLSALTSSSTRVASAVAALDSPLGSGGDLQEAGYEALYQIASGDGYRSGGVTWVAAFDGHAAPGGGELGGVGFRQDAMRVVVHVTDAPSHAASDYASAFPDTHGRVDAIAAMRALDIKLVGIATDPGARPQLEGLALATGATLDPVAGVCHTGVAGGARSPTSGTCPLVFDAREDGSGVSEAVVDGIVGLVDAIRYEQVYGRAVDDRFGFVRAIVAAEATPGASGVAPGLADLRPAGDGLDDTFTGVHVGTHLRFELRFQNDALRAEDYDQVFEVTLEIMGDSDVLTHLVVRVIVPLTRDDAGSADAGSADAGSADAGSADAGSADAGSADASSADAGRADASVDAAMDASFVDAMTADAGSLDAAAGDAGP